MFEKINDVLCCKKKETLSLRSFFYDSSNLIEPKAEWF